MLFGHIVFDLGHPLLPAPGKVGHHTDGPPYTVLYKLVESMWFPRHFNDELPPVPSGIEHCDVL